MPSGRLQRAPLLDKAMRRGRCLRWSMPRWKTRGGASKRFRRGEHVRPERPCDSSSYRTGDRLRKIKNEGAREYSMGCAKGVGEKMRGCLPSLAITEGPGEELLLGSSALEKGGVYKERQKSWERWGGNESLSKQRRTLKGGRAVRTTLVTFLSMDIRDRTDCKGAITTHKQPSAELADQTPEFWRRTLRGSWESHINAARLGGLGK